MIWAVHHRKALVKCTAVHIREGQEISQLVALSIVVQHPEALVTEETWVTRRKLVIGSKPSGKSQGCKLVFALLNMLNLTFFTHLPMKTWQTAHFCVVTLCLCVRSGYSFLSRQSFLWASLECVDKEGKRTRSIQRDETTALSHIRDIESCFHEWLPCLHQR